MHWMVVLAIVLVLFGAGKLPRVMGDFAKGIKAFKAGMKEPEDEAAATEPPAQVSPPLGHNAKAAGQAWLMTLRAASALRTGRGPSQDIRSKSAATL